MNALLFTFLSDAKKLCHELLICIGILAFSGLKWQIVVLVSLSGLKGNSYTISILFFIKIYQVLILKKNSSKFKFNQNLVNTHFKQGS